MKTAAAALLCLGLGCAAAGLPGDAADANCCGLYYLARYSLQPGGEDTSAFDCVAFVDKETCATRGGMWSDDSQLGPGGCAHSATPHSTWEALPKY